MTDEAAAAPSCLRHRKLYKNRRASPDTSVFDPDVWSGRALQEIFVELAVSGLASTSTSIKARKTRPAVSTTFCSTSTVLIFRNRESQSTSRPTRGVKRGRQALCGAGPSSSTARRKDLAFASGFSARSPILLFMIGSIWRAIATAPSRACSGRR